jgi:hypothetical protein
MRFLLSNARKKTAVLQERPVYYFNTDEVTVYTLRMEAASPESVLTIYDTKGVTSWKTTQNFTASRILNLTVFGCCTMPSEKRKQFLKVVLSTIGSLWAYSIF